MGRRGKRRQEEGKVHVSCISLVLRGRYHWVVKGGIADLGVEVVHIGNGDLTGTEEES